MNNPEVSIIAAVYMVEEYIKQCLDSILSQTYTDFELILVDDCSPDNCPEICDIYEKQDHRIKVIHKEKNEGLPMARKSGLDASCGKYILFVDSDDWIEKNMLEKLHQKAISGNFDVVHCDLVRFRDDNIIVPDIIFDTRGMKKAEIIINMIENNFPQYLHSKLFTRSLFRDVVWPEFQLREDTVTCIQLFLNAENIGYEYSILYHYRFNSNSLSSNNRKRYRQIYEVYRNYKTLESVIKLRSDYPLYQKAMEKTLRRFNSLDKWRAFFIAKRIFMAFIPYGLIVMYRYFILFNIKKFLSMFVPYGIIILCGKLFAKRTKP